MIKSLLRYDEYRVKPEDEIPEKLMLYRNFVICVEDYYDRRDMIYIWEFGFVQTGH